MKIGDKIDMNLTEKEAERALRSLEVLRREYSDLKDFRNELEISHLEGLDGSLRGAKVVISRDSNRIYSINMPYEYLMKWILDKMTTISENINKLESRFLPENQ